jgi:hypothetical protein
MGGFFQWNGKKTDLTERDNLPALIEQGGGEG